jgi:serine/threonine protein kinase
MNKSPKVLGEGSYGCIHRPPLKCKSPSSVITEGKVSKLIRKKEAETELKEYNLIQQADPEHQYYLGKPDVCDVDDSQANIAAISKCEMKKAVLEDMDNYQLLVMEYGGKNIQEYGRELRDLNKVTDAHRKLAQEFWVDFHQIMRGIQMLLKHRLVHHDMKTPNVLYCQKQRRMYLIDFGLMESIPESIQECRKNTYEMDINWWYFPYDSIWLTRRAFMDEIHELYEPSLPRYIKRKFTWKYEEDSEINNWMYSLQRMVQFTEEELNAAIDDFAEFVTETRENLDDGAYNRFVNQYFMTLDVYGLGVAGLELLGYTRKLVPDAFYHSARTFFLGLASFHPMRRPLIQTVLTDYEQILETTGMLKFDQTTFKFKDHVLVSVPKHQNFMIQSAHDAKESPRIADRTLEHMIEMDPIPSKKSKSATPVSPTLVPMLKTPSPKPSSPKSFFVARRTRKLHYKIPTRIRKRRKTAKNI